MKIKKILISAVMALSIVCCFSGLVADQSNDRCITNVLSLKPTDIRSFMIATNNYYCSNCGSVSHDETDCPYKGATAP
jgi:hypothetical protein